MDLRGSTEVFDFVEVHFAKDGVDQSKLVARMQARQAVMHVCAEEGIEAGEVSKIVCSHSFNPEELFR